MLLSSIGAVFAQANNGQGAPPAGAMAGIFICYGVVIIVGILIQILFLLNLYRCLGQCSPRNRTMEPGMVWLNLVPLLNIVWMFITVIKISESLNNEYRSRGLSSDDPDFGKTMGIIMAVCNLCCPGINLIFFIIYWVKIAGFKNQLMSGRGGDAGDDYDDRPRRSRDRDDEDEDDRPRRPRRDDN